MALFPRVTTWVSNQILTAAALNGEFNNILNNAQASSWVGYSANVAQMQQQASPGGVGSESLAGSVSDELQRLRYQLARIQGTTYWYDQTGGNFGAGGITTAMLASNAVTTAKLANSSVGAQQLAAANYSISASTTNSTVYSASAGHGLLTAISVTIAVSGYRPVMVSLVGGGFTISGQSAGSGNAPNYYLASSSGTTTIFQPTYTSTTFSTGVGGTGQYQNPGDVSLNAATASTAATWSYTMPCGGFNLFEAPAAGTYTYTLNIQPALRSGTNGIANVQLLAMEMF